MAFIRKNAAAKEAVFCRLVAGVGSFLAFPKKLTANGGITAEPLAPLDVRIGDLMR